MNPIVAALLAFTLGVFVGASWRAAFEILTGKKDTMAAFGRTIQRVLHPTISLLSVMLLLSLLLNASVGVGIIVADSKDRALERCQVEFNQKTADARETRVEVSTGAVLPALIEYVKADLAYQESLSVILSTEVRDMPALIAAIDARADAARDYHGALEAQEEISTENPYPPADYCSSLED